MHQASRRHPPASHPLGILFCLWWTREGEEREELCWQYCETLIVRVYDTFPVYPSWTPLHQSVRLSETRRHQGVCGGNLHRAEELVFSYVLPLVLFLWLQLPELLLPGLSPVDSHWSALFILWPSRQHSRHQGPVRRSRPCDWSFQWQASARMDPVSRASLRSSKHNTVVLVSLLSGIFSLNNSKLLEEREVYMFASLVPIMVLGTKTVASKCMCFPSE